MMSSLTNLKALFNMKKIYLTFDIETIVSGLGFNSNYLGGVYLGTMYIAQQLRERNLKATFFVSLSSKMDEIPNKEYQRVVEWLLKSLKGYDNIKIAPHMHAYKLDASFDCKYDFWNMYKENEQKELLGRAKILFEKYGLNADAFRPGGFKANEEYYRGLNESGYKFSSILNKKSDPQIDLITGNCHNLEPFETSFSVIEYPVSSVKVKSFKGSIETLNLSPDFFTLESIKPFLDKLNYLNINFHSFSVFLNRPLRENFSMLLLRNIRFVLFDFWLCKLLRVFGYDLLRKETVHRKELTKWLDYIESNNYQTYFIGE